MKNNYPKLTQYLLDIIGLHMDSEVVAKLESARDWQHPGEFLTEYMVLDPGFPLHQFNTAVDVVRQPDGTIERRMS